MTLPISFQDIVAAAARIRDTAHRTPVMTSRTADNATGASLFFKCENLQRMGAFKFRGALNALCQLTPAQRDRGVVAYSSGNHAQAIALAARLQGIAASIVMPRDAPTIKLVATRGYGGDVVLYDRYTQDREAIGGALAAKHGLTLIPPYDHPHVMAGQGTAALELFEDVGKLDLLLVPLGGGGLLSGCATVAKTLHPRCEVIGVEPAAGNDGQRSLAEGHIVHIDTPQTLADGAQTQHLGEHTFPVIQARVDRIDTVSDESLVQAMHFFATRMKLLVEPTGCLAAALAFERRPAWRGKRIGIILSGGNIDLARFAALIATIGDAFD
jgi:threonine dehydratase